MTRKKKQVEPDPDLGSTVSYSNCEHDMMWEDECPECEQRWHEEEGSPPFDKFEISLIVGAILVGVWWCVS